jgi:uncharacterized protein YqeY
VTAAVTKAAMRRDLTAAMRERRVADVSALRGAIAAIDNAEAVDTEGIPDGVTEVERRRLAAGDVADVLRAHRDDALAEARRYEALGQHAAAQRLRREAEVVSAYL